MNTFAAKPTPEFLPKSCNFHACHGFSHLCLLSSTVGYGPRPRTCFVVTTSAGRLEHAVDSSTKTRQLINFRIQ